MSKKTGTNVFILKASPKVYWAAAGADPGGNVIFEKARKKYNLSVIETIRFLAYKEEFPEANERDLVFKAKTYSEHSRIDESEMKNYWKEELVSSIRENRVQVRAEPVHTVDDNKLCGYEVFSQIRHSDKTISSYGVISKWLEEFEMFNEYNLHVYKKAFEYFEDSDVDVHLNITTREIRDDAFIESLLDLIYAYRMNKRIVVELKDTVSNDNFIEIQDFIKLLKDQNIRVAIDNVGIHYHKMSYLVMLDVDYINIDKALIDIDANDPASLVLEMILAATSKIESEKKKKLIALKIETQEEYEKVKSFGFSKFQGWLLKGEHIVF